MYPPYWYYRAKAAQESGDDSEALRCWDKFAEVWRPVLRNDPYKLEEAKYRVQRIAANSESNREEIRRLLGVIQDNTTAGDWSNNLFAGVAYFLLGDKDEGIACVEVNVDFGYEEAVSKTILAEMKKGELDAFTLYALQRDIESAIEKPNDKPQTKQAEVKQPEPKKQTAGKRRDLSKEEIIYITRKFGFYERDMGDVMREHMPEEKRYIQCYTYYIWFSWLDFPKIAFCSDGIYWQEKSSAPVKYLSYDELRNDPSMTYEKVREMFHELPDLDDVVGAVMTLRELE